jgi:hypothetical protein
LCVNLKFHRMFGAAPIIIIYFQLKGCVSAKITEFMVEGRHQ